jgi:hypothetical protein
VWLKHYAKTERVSVLDRRRHLQCVVEKNGNDWRVQKESQDNANEVDACLEHHAKTKRESERACRLNGATLCLLKCTQRNCDERATSVNKMIPQDRRQVQSEVRMG